MVISYGESLLEQAQDQGETEADSAVYSLRGK